MTPPPQWSPHGSDSVDPAALNLLATGLSRPKIARQQSISVRLLEDWISEIRQAVGATTPYALGMLIVRSGRVDPQVAIDLARQRRDCDDWVAPTTRQHAIVQLLTTGSTYGKAATSLGRSARTARRQFRRLTEANGVGGLLPAGALFEALNWHDPPEPAAILE